VGKTKKFNGIDLSGQKEKQKKKKKRGCTDPHEKIQENQKKKKQGRPRHCRGRTGRGKQLYSKKKKGNLNEGGKKETQKHVCGRLHKGKKKTHFSERTPKNLKEVKGRAKTQKVPYVGHPTQKGKKKGGGGK